MLDQFNRVGGGKVAINSQGVDSVWEGVMHDPNKDKPTAHIRTISGAEYHVAHSYDSVLDTLSSPATDASDPSLFPAKAADASGGD